MSPSPPALPLRSKADIGVQYSPSQKPKTSWTRFTISIVACWALVGIWKLTPATRGSWNWGTSSTALQHDTTEPLTEEAAFHWEDVIPSTSLRYTPCFSGFLCARLSVPLNWNATAKDQEIGPRAAIAIIKKPAQVPVTDLRYGGPVIVNPGGPGESGIHQVLTDGKNLQTVLDDTSEAAGGGKYFDILSFDPRGVNNTRPALRCFTDAIDQQAWTLSLPDYGLLWSSDSVVGMEWARAEALGASCSNSQGDDNGGILKHANTAQTVEDMVQIIEKEGEWRAAEADRLLSLASCQQRPSAEQSRAILERTAYVPGREMLQYWGMSYGTLIGTTFAAMHPDRVHRMVLDGVVDPADHYAGTWLTQLQDSDAIISKFCEYCFLAGRGACPLYENSSADDIERRLTSILLNLKSNPIAMPPLAAQGSRSAGPSLVTYGDAHLMLLSAMYFPFATAETFFDLLPALEARNTSSPVLRRIVAGKQARLRAAGCGGGEKGQTSAAAETGACVPYVSGNGAFQAISCMDMGGGPADNLTRAQFAEYREVLQAQGRWISPSWARNKLACLGYTVRPAWRPGLTFQRREWAATAHPLLVIGNTHDTVTPVRNAHRVAGLFPGSVVLRQDGQGHCSHSTPSMCTARTVRRYFQTGELPQPDAVCKPEARPFIGCIESDEHDGEKHLGECRFADGEEARLYKAMAELADPFGLRPNDREGDLGSLWARMSWMLPMA